MPIKGNASATSYFGKCTRQSDAKSRLGMNSKAGQVVHNLRMREEKEKRERDRQLAELTRLRAEEMLKEEQQKQIEAVKKRNRELLRMCGGNKMK